MCVKNQKLHGLQHTQNRHTVDKHAFNWGLYFLGKQSERAGTCECGRDVVLDLNVHKESRQGERHVALTAQADVMETCRA